MTTPFGAVLGFVLVTLGGAVLRRRGRRTGGILLGGTAAICVVALCLTFRHEVVGQFVVGGLAGFPVLLAFAWAADKDARSGRGEV